MCFISTLFQGSLKEISSVFERSASRKIAGTFEEWFKGGSKVSEILMKFYIL